MLEGLLPIEPAVQRVRRRKADLYKVIAGLHKEHFTDATIGHILGFDRGDVRTVLTSMNLFERWSDPADALKSVSPELRAECLRLSTNVGIKSL